MITQALVPLRTFVVDQFNALSNKIRILEVDLRHHLDQLETEVNRTCLSKARHNQIPMLFFPLQPSLLFKLLTNPLLVNLPQTQIIPSNQPLMRSLLMNESSTLLFMVSQNLLMVQTGQIDPPTTLIVCSVLF